MSDDAPEGERDPLGYLAGLLDDEPGTLSLREQIERIAHQGVEQKLIVLDPETGLARLSGPEPPAALRGLQDIQTALSTGAGQLAALAALGVELVEAPAIERMIAGEIRDDVALVAGGSAPATVLERIGPLLRSETRLIPGASVSAWFQVTVQGWD